MGAGLAGVTVIVTRSEETSGELRRALEARGARVVGLPAIRHALATDLEAFRRAAERRAEFACVALTSPTAVRFFLEATEGFGLPPEAWNVTILAAVGAKTAAVLRERGLEPRIVADGSGESLARAILQRDLLPPRARVLLPRSSRARPELAEALQRAGLAVEAVTIYDTIDEDPARLAPLMAEAIAATIGSGGPAAAIFASPSAFGSFLAMAGEGGRDALARGALKIVTIGPTTSAAVRDRGYPVASEADSPGVEGMVLATTRLFSS